MPVSDEDDPCAQKHVEKKEAVYELKTCPFDPRFPNTNQTRYCYVSYIDYHRCSRLLPDYENCEYFKKCYTSLCPHAWVEKWDEQIENGNFAGSIYPPKKKD